MKTVGLPGLDLQALENWLQDRPFYSGGTLEATHIVGGKSNLTFIVSDGDQRWVVRRPPLGHVLATAHNMSREHRVMAALEETEVPVPRMYALCEDETVIGAPFFVMEYVEGTPYRLASELETLGADATRGISSRMVDVLAQLHAIEPEAVGLADFGRPEGFLPRQVKRWKQQIDASYSRDLPEAELLHSRLMDAVPPESSPAIVHGDFRLDNLLVREDRVPVALIDWEMATLGDPLTDLALMLVYHRLGETRAGGAVFDAASAPGFLSESEILDRYVATSPHGLDNFGFYLGLASFKLAGIFEGIHFRYLKGQTVGEGFDSIGQLVVPTLESGLNAIKGEY